jgi:hypothetical protein
MYHHPISFQEMGNLRIYDIRRSVSLKKVQHEFRNLTQDKYVPEGFRRKHIIRYIYYPSNHFYQKPNQPLYQNNTINPTHGDIEREYPEFDPKYRGDFYKILYLFKHFANLKGGEHILVQAQRITCSPESSGLPSVEGWHRDGVDGIGVLCVNRYNIVGGINEFRHNESPDRKISYMMQPGQFAVFDDDSIMHRVTPIISADGINPGYRDVMLFGFPDCTK